MEIRSKFVRDLTKALSGIGSKSLNPKDLELIAAIRAYLVEHPRMDATEFNVSGITSELGFSRSRYYRSPVFSIVKRCMEQIKENELPKQDEAQKIAALEKSIERLRQEKNEEITYLRKANAIYANEIQRLTLLLREADIS